MIQKLVKGYGQLFSSILKVLFLLGLCAACGAVVVFPLWKFATAAPKAYTAVALAAIVLAAVIAAAKKAKSAGAKKSLLFAAKFLVVAGGAFLVFALVVFGQKLLALPAIVLIIFLYGILSFKAKS